ncbi:neutral/alkaline non-lysosomal ceramidase N-terminal domain-containing protein [Tsukamurella sp. 8F]|uniref:neutral/alkaline non-lysosomal ceramidase N-terminal domain-containing protein n=1 Tax=unclassified Tsukamurella TaxID=2633480 RepID=UPI0023B92C01|nr:MULTISPECIES: neutral/alkaline non-lysosomal ceramidase N-terminal domain-containing protein [unclassified Tsukamurella]MDF0531067.1 neutral/alkaline non-lysosomal ceramidase N-terminal domain-containing protein [Tsukamurella sp. 8J]MDF0585466.1 neutral/alkaline non-lysosomal ceramidase N-terminal domain-containing protein [Tsukamurella sp. 8F]
MAEQRFRAGWAKVDITGEPWGVGMMGYGMPGQRSTGLLSRQYARAFVFEAGGRRLAYVVADIGMFFQATVDDVRTRLERRCNGRYTAANTVLTATHTHCGPGGFGDHALYNVTTGGRHPRTRSRLVSGVVRAIVEADAGLRPVDLSLARGELLDASVNRSPDAFAANPIGDRDALPDGIDPAMTLLRVHAEGELAAALDWFAVHCTSMTNTNRLISSDNKGWAASAWERERGSGFVAAFAQSNSGDMSPNLNGSAGHGPYDDERENTAEIGRRQLDLALRLAAEPGEPLAPALDWRATVVDLARSRTPDGPTGRAVLGAAFAAGTSDGLGARVFRQGLGNRIGAASRWMYRRRPELARVQAPKEMLLPVGPMGWVAEQVPVQLVRLGEPDAALHLVCLPVEVTVTAGRRLRAAVAETLSVDPDSVLVQGYANGYAHYLTTPEEYDVQRYEGGSTLFGRNELAAFVDASTALARAMADGTPGPAPVPARHPRPRLPVSPLGSPLLAARATSRILRVRDLGERVVVDVTTAHPNAYIPSSYVRIERPDGRELGDDDPGVSIEWRRRGTGFVARITYSPSDDGPFRIGFRGRRATVWTHELRGAVTGRA